MSYLTPMNQKWHVHKKNKKPKRLNLTFAQSLCSHTAWNTLYKALLHKKVPIGFISNKDNDILERKLWHVFKVFRKISFWNIGRRGKWLCAEETHIVRVRKISCLPTKEHCLEHNYVCEEGNLNNNFCKNHKHMRIHHARVSLPSETIKNGICLVQKCEPPCQTKGRRRLQISLWITKQK